MRRIINFLLCLLGPLGMLQALAQTPTPLPVQGNLSSIIGSGQQYAGVSIQLQNCASPVSITGYSVIVQQGYQVMANGAGIVNTTVWPNDLIDCNGTTGNSQYQLSYTADGAVQGTPQCYQVVSTQGTWNLNTQQPINCSQSAPNPQDGSYRNITSTGFLQGNNGAMSGNFTVNGLLKALGGFQIGTTSQNCPSGQYQTGLTDFLVPICSTLPVTVNVTSFNGRTGIVVPASGDYTYSQISGTPSSLPPSGTAGGSLAGAYPNPTLSVTGATSGSYACPTITINSEGRITSISNGSCNPSNACTSYTSSASAGCTVTADGKWMEWAQGTTQSTSGSTQTVYLPVAFPNNIYSVMVGTINKNGGGPTDADMSFFQAVSQTTSSVTVFMMRNADHAFDPAAPTVWAIGN